MFGKLFHNLAYLICTSDGTKQSATFHSYSDKEINGSYVKIYFFIFTEKMRGPAEATAEVHPPDIPDSSRDTSVERSSQEIPSVRQEESNMGNMVLQTPPNSSFSSLDASCQPKEKTDFKKSNFGRQLLSFQAAWFARYP